MEMNCLILKSRIPERRTRSLNATYPRTTIADFRSSGSLVPRLFPCITARYRRCRRNAGLTVFLRRRSKCIANGQLFPREALYSSSLLSSPRLALARAAWFQRQKTGAKRKAAVFPAGTRVQDSLVFQRAAGAPLGAGSCHFETVRQ